MLKLAIFLVAVNFLSVLYAQSPKTSTTTTTTTSTAPTAVKPGDPFNLTFVVTGKDLPNNGKTSKADPYVKVFHRTGGTQNGSDWTLFGTSDTIKDEASPEWNNVYSFVWKKGTNQVWHFEVKDHDTYNKDDAIGQADVNVDEYVEKNQDLTVKLSDGGTLTIKKTTPVNFRLYARNLPKMDEFGGLSDPYVLVNWRRGKEGTDIPIGTGRTETQNNLENVDWPETFEFSNYQKGTNQFWHFIVKDADSISGDDDLGEVLLEVDPFIQKRAAKVNKLSTDANNKGTLTVTPA
jgi:Ca2+-dependent lipid-binding protein